MAEKPRKGIIGEDLPLTILVAVATTVIMGLLRVDRAPTLVGVAVAPLIADIVKNVASSRGWGTRPFFGLTAIFKPIANGWARVAEATTKRVPLLRRLSARATPDAAIHKRAGVRWFAVVTTAVVAAGATVAFFTLPELVLGRALVAPDRPTTFFSSAEPAPPRVVKEFEDFSEGAPAGMDPRVNARETRRVGVGGGHVLWVAPTKPGGYCYVWEDSSGGCDSRGTVPLSVTWGGEGAPLSPERRSYQIVEGIVRTRWADDVEITLDDGTTVHPRVIWVSPPIDAGFFYYRASQGRAIESVRALRDGEVMTADTTGSGAQPGPHPFADLSKRRRVAEIQTSAGPVTLWTAPTRTEERCTWLEFRNEEKPAVPCLPKGYEQEAGLAFNAYAFDGHTVLVGQCGYRAVELLQRVGRIRTVDCTDGLLFAELRPADAAGEMRAVDANGNPVRGTRGPVPQPR